MFGGGRTVSLSALRRSGALGGLIALLLSAPAVLAQDRPAPKNVTLLGIPSATVAPHGLVFGSLSVSSDVPGPVTHGDGSLALGFGLGSAEENVGLQVTSYFTNFSDSIGGSGYLAFSASRRVSAGSTPLYAGLSIGQVGGWGNSSALDPSATVTLTGFSALVGRDGEVWPLMFTLGGGSNIRNGETDPGLFAGVGIGLTEELGASVAWYGDHVNLGTSYRPQGTTNGYFTASLIDAFDQQDSRRAVVSFNLLLGNLFGS